MKHIASMVLCLFVLIFASQAVTATLIDVDHKRYTALINDIRCPVCQGQSISESNAAIARDLRQLVRQLIGEGRSDGEIHDYLVTRYGDFISFQPPLTIVTMLLWLLPFVCVIGGLVLFARRVRKQ